MDRSDAHALVAIMDTAWPQAGLVDDDGTPTLRGQMFATDLERHRPEDGVAAVAALRETVTWHGGPTPADLLVALKDARGRRALGEGRALPADLDLAGAPLPMPDAARTAIAEFHRSTDWIPPRDKLDGPARIEAIRRRTLRRIESPDAEETPFVYPTAARRTACGATWGTPAVRDDGGVWRCPSCGEPIATGCLTPRADAVTQDS